MRSPDGAVLLDCGGTTGTGLAALGIPRGQIDAVLVSHFHADHFGGIPLLLLAMRHEDRRSRPLLVAGPVGVEARVRAAAAALGHPLADEDWPFPLRFQELRPGAPAAIGPAEVRAAGARHHPDARPLVLDVAAGGRRIVYTGDTGWFDGLPDLARGADLFVLLTHLGEEMARRRGACAFETADDGLVIAL